MFHYILCIIYYILYYRRKFSSQTSDKMDRWKSRGGKSQRGEEPKREDTRRERVRGKKIHVREKVGKSQNAVFLHWFVAPEGRKVGSLKRRVRSHVVRWEMQKCTRLWREAHFRVKTRKTHQRRTTFGRWDVEKVHAVVAWSTFGSQNAQSTSVSDRFWKLRCRKSARDRHKGFCTSKGDDCVAVPKTIAGVGYLKRIRKDTCSVRGAVQETWSSEILGGQGSDVLRGVAFWSIRSVGLLKWCCVTGAALRLTSLHFFVVSTVL